MPLGKIIQLIMGGFKRQSSELPAIPNKSAIEPLKTEESTLFISTESDFNNSATVCEDSSSSINLVPTNTHISAIAESKNMINFSMLQQELQTFVSGSADIQGAALVSPDGLALASVLAADMDEERTAAMSASILSLGERIASELARGIVERIVVEGEKGYAVLVGCGAEAVLLVLAGASVKQGILFLEVKRVVTKLSPLLG